MGMTLLLNLILMQLLGNASVRYQLLPSDFSLISHDTASDPVTLRPLLNSSSGSNGLILWSIFTSIMSLRLPSSFRVLLLALLELQNRFISLLLNFLQPHFSILLLLQQLLLRRRLGLARLPLSKLLPPKFPLSA